MHTVTLQDGTVLGNLTLNGNNYISDTLIDDAVFENNLDTVTINDGESTQVYENMKLIANQIFDGKSWFVLAEKSPQDIEKELMEKKISDLEQVIDTMLNGGGE